MVEMDAWAVAAALLIRLGKALHHTDLTARGVATKLSGLGFKGGSTPAATLRAIMGSKEFEGRRVFARVGKGLYSVPDAGFMRQIPEVRAALEALVRFDDFGNRMTGEESIEELRERIRDLEQQNINLRSQVEILARNRNKV